MKHVLLIISLALLFGCAMMATKIGDIKSNPDNYLGKEVTVSGTVTDSIKIGGISGYAIEDATGSIKVSSESLPAEGSTVTVSGTLVKDSLFGYYIQAKG